MPARGTPLPGPPRLPGGAPLPGDAPPSAARATADARTAATAGSLNAAHGGGPPLPSRPAEARTTPRDGAVPGRRARLAVARIDPRSACGVAFVLCTVLGVAMVVAVVVLQAVLASAGVTASLNAVLVDQLQLPAVLGTSKVVIAAAVVAALQVVVGTLLAGLLAMAYNVTATFTGGLGLVLGDR